MVATINPDATVIPDKAEVWLILKQDVPGNNIAAKIPTNATDDPGAKGWEFSGLIDDKKGIPLDPSGEVKEYDAFGHPNFRTKFRKGKLKSGFTALEYNAVTRKVVLPGSTPDKLGIPKDVQIYVLYRYVDEDITRMWVALRPALAELKSHGGIVDGELSFAEITVHHTADANGDVFKYLDSSTADDVTKTFTIDSGVTAYTATVGTDTTVSLTTKTAYALQSALRDLDSVQALDAPGVTVEGPDGGPLVAVFTGTVPTVSATGTGGTVAVS
ncbi:Uncharacterised protein [Mycobacteroides abscessus subsp. abscessus]|uniref:hypothetical protein n=1 Tax=Mycobacteroides abscessus TaxID=36809 RepID=UPI0009282546|nr:hypothetical protein [Mycobacteroides abscessus]SII86789.1 Uncharacterised protein [Mycobacteroides abscessus subsp. abscessus]SIK03328.1 Uncharacterised protein [Mycobacteroides abscessus subsp. abscessus]SIK08156.1 Uncharacterised protein [Mycobacteroides abscessus subsp. abscessus]SIN56865.1 Uncharacterised protein [Mycobacteroides abscessus subsp. abscessus]SLF25834.1 Uncharacterised protein [Mycobacteroides abscessus subsp. abscessus]